MSLPLVVVTPYTFPNAVEPLCVTNAFITPYSEFVESCKLMNSSAALYVDALKVIIVTALDVKLVELVSVLETPPDAKAVLSNPTIANILAAACGAEVNVMLVELTE